VACSRGGGGVFGQVFFQADQAVNAVGVFHQLLVLADGEDGFADDAEDFEAGFFEEFSESVGGEGGGFELFFGVWGEPVGAGGGEELFEGVEVTAIDEVVDGCEFVVGGGDDDAAGGADAEHFAGCAGGVGADGDGVAHGGGESEGGIGERAEIDDIGDEERGFFRFSFAHLFDLLAGLLDHGAGVVDEGGGEAGLEEFSAPLAGAAA